MSSLDYEAFQWQGNNNKLPQWLNLALDTVGSPFTEGSIGFAGNILYIGSNNGLLRVLPGDWIIKHSNGKITIATETQFAKLQAETK